MGISKKYKFILLRNHKCGSTTCFLLLKKYLDITGINHTEGVFPKYKNKVPWFHANVNVWKEYIKQNKIRGEFKTITTVRNPWARMYSLYTYNGYHSKTFGKNGFKQFVKNIKSNRYPFRTFIFNEKGEKLIDYVIKLEELSTEFPKIMKKFNINLSENQCKKIFNKSNNEDYRKYYDEETKNIVYNMFKHEIEYFNYEFDK